MTNTIIIIICIAVGLFLAFLIWRKKKPKTQSDFWDLLRRECAVEIPDNPPYKHNYTTPLGAKVNCYNPMPEHLKNEKLRAIDIGLTRLVTRYSNAGIADTEESDFTVMMIPPMSYGEESGLPRLNTKPPTVIGTAGTVIGAWNAMLFPPIILVAENYEDKAGWTEFLSEAVHNEGEHALLAWKNRTLFLYYTNERDIHPFPIDRQNVQ